MVAQPAAAGATCPHCGAQNQPRAVFCGNCGQAIAAPARGGVPIPETARYPAAAAKAQLQTLWNDIRDRDRTDRKVSFWWVLISPVLFYKLIARRNRHFARAHRLCDDLLAAARTLASSKGVDVELQLASCERVVRETKEEESEKGAALWVILSFATGVAALYVFYFLTKDMPAHRKREQTFVEQFGAVSTTLGIAPLAPRDAGLPNRSFGKYLVLSIVTLGIFGVYWAYRLTKDPEAHFAYHQAVEDTLFSALDAALR